MAYKLLAERIDKIIPAIPVIYSPRTTTVSHRYFLSLSYGGQRKLRQANQGSGLRAQGSEGRAQSGERRAQAEERKAQGSERRAQAEERRAQGAGRMSQGEERRVERHQIE